MLNTVPEIQKIGDEASDVEKSKSGNFDQVTK